MRFSLLILTVIGCTSFAFANDVERFDPQQPYSAERSNPVTYDVEFQVIVTARSTPKPTVNRFSIPIRPTQNKLRMPG